MWRWATMAGRCRISRAHWGLSQTTNSRYLAYPSCGKGNNLSVLRIGINALYFLPGGVGGTEIYLRSLLRSLHAIDATNSYCVYVNQETGSELEVEAPRFHFVRCPIKASFRPSRILYEQVMLPILVARHLIDVL